MQTGPARFFGYGSLVNRATQSYPGAQAARLTGWRRVWVQTGRPLALLSAEPAPGVVIDGLVAEVPGSDWAALDRREAAYLRHAVTTDCGPAQVYAVPAGPQASPGQRHPILLSYLDVVVQGFLREFGPGGAARFFASTAGWDCPVLDDRAAPRYPRAQRLDAAETDLVDGALAALGVVRLPA